jgi:hypothetical protein
MKKSMLAVAALAVFIAPMTSVAADDGSFYIKGNAGIDMVLDSDINNLPDIDGTAEMRFENGFAVSIAAGYDFANPLRIEIESLIRENDIDGLSNNDLDIDFKKGDLFSRFIMLNGYYDLDTGSS